MPFAVGKERRGGRHRQRKGCEALCAAVFEAPALRHKKVHIIWILLDVLFQLLSLSYTSYGYCSSDCGLFIYLVSLSYYRAVEYDNSISPLIRSSYVNTHVSLSKEYKDMLEQVHCQGSRWLISTRLESTEPLERSV